MTDDTALPAQAGSEASTGSVSGGCGSSQTGSGVLAASLPLSGEGTALGLRVGVWTPVAIWKPPVRGATGEYLGLAPSNWRDLAGAPYGAAEASALHMRGLVMMAQRRNADGVFELVVQPSSDGIAEAQAAAARNRMTC